MIPLTDAKNSITRIIADWRLPHGSLNPTHTIE
jgi:hypothetical protein